MPGGGDLCGCHGGGSAVGTAGRIQQNGVVANHLSSAVVGLQDHVQERIAQGSVAGQAQHRAAIDALYARTDAADYGVVIQSTLGIVGCRCQPGAQFAGAGIQDFHFSVQGLAQCGLHMQLSEPQGVAVGADSGHDEGSRHGNA